MASRPLSHNNSKREGRRLAMKRPVKFVRKRRRSYKYPENYQLQSTPKDTTLRKELLKIYNESPDYYSYVSGDDSCDLDWYPNWLEHQLSSISPDVVKFSCHEPSDNDSEHYAQPHQIRLDAVDPVFWKLWVAIAEYINRHECCDLGDLIPQLISEKHFVESEGDICTLYYQRQLVFAILGWQSMLYLPSLKYGQEHYLTILKDSDQVNSGLIYENLSVSADHADGDMADLLTRYGNLLPRRSSQPQKAGPSISKETPSLVSLAEIDIHTLATLLQLRIQWVETLALHLDYDQGTRTLSLFRYPSMCVAALRSRGALYSFADRGMVRHPSIATPDDITSMLREILSSYRLLFGQSKKSRQYFLRQIRRLNPTLFSTNSDTLLLKLCSEKTIEHSAVPPDRPLYFAERDFPVLGVRLKMLVDDLKRARPRTWMGLLRDRRDITQYWTFWLVAIFGSLSVLLGVVQAVLQGLALKSSTPA